MADQRREPEEGAVRLVMFTAMAASSWRRCASRRRSTRRPAFRVAYGVVRWSHIALFVLASRDDPRLRQSVIGLAGDGARVRLLLAPPAPTAWRRARCGRWRSCSTGRPVLLRRRGLEAGCPALRRAPRAHRHHRPRRVDRGDRRRRRPRRRRGRGGCRGRRHRGLRRPVVALLRRGRAGGRATAGARRRAASTTRSPATPTRSSTSRWSPASCCSPSA